MIANDAPPPPRSRPRPLVEQHTGSARQGQTRPVQTRSDRDRRGQHRRLLLGLPLLYHLEIIIKDCCAGARCEKRHAKWYDDAGEGKVGQEEVEVQI